MIAQERYNYVQYTIVASQSFTKLFYIVQWTFGFISPEAEAKPMSASVDSTK